MTDTDHVIYIRPKKCEMSEIFIRFYVNYTHNFIRKSVNDRSGVMKWLIWKGNC